MVSVKMKWVDGIKFEGTGNFGHTIITDGPLSADGTEAGFKATELLLYGVAACTGVDVVRILKKQRQELTSLEIKVTGHQDEDYPKPFHSVEIKYVVRGENLNETKLARAIDLSESKYCVVSQTIQRETSVTTSYEILPE